jgi:hypothetical protein
MKTRPGFSIIPLMTTGIVLSDGTGTASSYWEGSPGGGSASFCNVNSIGYTNYYGASSAGGVASAFCVR